MKTYLLLDCNYLCHRAFHSIRDLSFEDEPTSVIYGFFRELILLQNHFNTTNLVFCFDYGKNKRIKLCPEYKAKRRSKRSEYTEEEKNNRKLLERQITRLRKHYLPSLGYRNIFSQWGHEADDLIAACADKLRKEKKTSVVISADRDLLQCLSKYTAFYNPQQKKLTTAKKFRKTYKIKPYQWALVKAIAGCPSDNVIGIKGVGEKTAADYISNNLKKDSVKYNSIVKGIGIQKANIRLVFLPFEGTLIPELQKDEATRRRWRKVMGRLGMDSLIREYQPTIS